MMSVTIEAVGTEPVTAAEVKNYLKIDTTADDTLIGDIIAGAREWAEQWTHRLTEVRAVTLELDASEAKSPIYLPFVPAVSITSIKEYSAAGVASSAIANTNYLLVGDRIEMLNDGWQVNKSRKAIQVIYECGEEATATNLSGQFKILILEACAMLYENRVINLDRELGPHVNGNLCHNRFDVSFAV